MSDHNILRVGPSTRRGRAPFEAHQLVRHPGTGRLSFSRRDWLRDLVTAADRLTFGALRQLGLGYGWCCFCGKGLTDPRSIVLGIGPDCIKGFPGRPTITRREAEDVLAGRRVWRDIV